MVHLPVMGSGSEMMMKGGSSRKVIRMENFSGTPWGGTWLLSGQTMSLMSSPVSVFQLPTCRQSNSMMEIIWQMENSCSVHCHY